MKTIPNSRSLTVVAMMIVFLMASISAASALLFTQRAVASIDGQENRTANDANVTMGAATTSTGTSPADIGNSTPTTLDSATQRVAVGAGNITFSVNQFSPQVTQIQPGESVTFYAPSGSTELHNVIFDMTNGTTISDIGVPFTLPSDTLGGEVPTDVSEELLPAPPYNLGEPIIQNMADGTQAIVGFNKIAFYPAVVDQNGNVMYPEEEEIGRQMVQMGQAFEQGTPISSPVSTSYTMQGTERLVSSGIVLDVNGFSVLEELFPEEEGLAQEELGAEDNREMSTNSTTTTTTTATTPPISAEEETMAQQEEQTSNLTPPPPPFPFLGSFTVTFEEPGTYDYFCAFHPGMFGQVIVGGSNSSVEGRTNQTTASP